MIYRGAKAQRIWTSCGRRHAAGRVVCRCWPGGVPLLVAVTWLAPQLPLRTPAQ